MSSNSKGMTTTTSTTTNRSDDDDVFNKITNDDLGGGVRDDKDAVVVKKEAQQQEDEELKEEKVKVDVRNKDNGGSTGAGDTSAAAANDGGGGGGGIEVVLPPPENAAVSSTSYDDKPQAKQQQQQQQHSQKPDPPGNESSNLKQRPRQHKQQHKQQKQQRQEDNDGKDDDDELLTLLDTSKPTIVNNNRNYYYCHNNNKYVLFWINGYSAILLFLQYLISLESIFSVILCVIMTIYTYSTIDDNIESNASFDGNIMNWVLLTFAVVSPMSISINMAFTRRERSLNSIATMKATLLNLYGAHSTWDWSKPDKPSTTGRVACIDVNWFEHADDTMHIMYHLSNEITNFLTLPTNTRSRHKVTQNGRKQAMEISKLSNEYYRLASCRLAQLTTKCEVLKRHGLPPNEAIRIRQWERFLSEHLDTLRVMKQYRTPQALRSFARLFSVFLPPFYAPYYGQLAYDLNSLPMAIIFASVTSIALTSLFESIYQMEDCFIGSIALDGIDVRSELNEQFHRQLLDRRYVYFSSDNRSLPPPPWQTKCVPDNNDGKAGNNVAS